MHITLCGIKHAGKSTIAAALAEVLHFPMLDTDEILRKMYEQRTKENCTVRMIYQKLGEQDFRKLEVEAVRSAYNSLNSSIIALGGGVLSNPGITQNDLVQLGFICWLDIDDETAFARIRKDGLPPFLASEPDPFAAFCKRNIRIREACRKAAQCRIITDTEVNITAEKIINAYKETAV